MTEAIRSFSVGDDRKLHAPRKSLQGMRWLVLLLAACSAEPRGIVLWHDEPKRT